MTGRFLRGVWLVFAVLVILYALLVISAREMLPLINHYQPQINEYLSRRTGTDVHIARLSGLWRGLRPAVDLENVMIAGRDGVSEGVFFDRINAELHPGRSLLNRTPVWSLLKADLVRVHLDEDAQGRWSIAGHPLAMSGDAGNLDYLYRMLFYSRLLHLERVEVTLRFYSGTQTTVSLQDIRIDNSTNFHRATARLALDEGKETAVFIFEGRGDPLDVDDFEGQGYVRLRQLRIDGSLGALLRGWVPTLAAKIQEAPLDLDMELWFDWRDNALVNGRGRIAAGEVPLPWVNGSASIRNLKGDVTGWFEPGRDWGMRLQNLSGTWNDDDLEPFNVQIRQRVGKRWRELDVATSQINLAFVSGLLLNAELLPDKGLAVLEQLDIQGSLRDVMVELDFSGERPDFRLRAQLHEVGLDPWAGAPAVRGLSGYLETSLLRGSVTLDCPAGLALHYHQAYDSFMPYSCARGRVAWSWQPEEEQVLVTSSLLSIDGEEGAGTAQLHLELPTRRGLRDPQMYLMVGLRNGHSRFMDRYVPRVLNATLRDWLSRAVGEAEIEEAGFVWRGSLLRGAENARSLQFYANVRRGTLDYLPPWPALEAVEGTVVVNNAEVDAWLHAQAAEADVSAAGVTIRQTGEGPILRVAGDIHSSVEHALAVLDASPLAESLGRITRLDVSGAADIEIELAIPLRRDTAAEDYRVGIALRDGSLTLPNTHLRIDAIAGELHYQRDTGLDSTGLNGRFLDGDLVATVDGQEDATVLKVSGNPSIAALADYLGPLSGRAQGRMKVEGTLSIPENLAKDTLKLSLSSDLNGVSIDLPAPFGKEAAEGAVLSSTTDFGDEQLFVQGAVEGRGAFALAFSKGELLRGEVRLLADEAQLPNQGGLLISGHLKRLDWQDWQPLISSNEGRQDDVAQMLAPRLDLHFDEAIFGGFDLGATHLRGRAGSGGEWLFSVEAPRIAGRVVVPRESGKVLALDLDYLKLPAPKEGAGESNDNDGLAALLPKDVPDMDFYTAMLYRGDRALGNLGFATRGVSDGLLIRDIRGQLNGIEIRPQPVSEDEGDEVAAEMRWFHDGQQQRTFFSGTLATDDIEKALAGWGIPAPLTSKSSQFFAEIGWPGQPWDMKLLSLEGYLGLELRDGQFYRATGAATNTLFKLISLVNFDTWLRRLRFDFSDIFSGGVSFDRVEGGLLFRKGRVEFDDPIVAFMPSGRIRLMGRADLLAEQLDARLVATMPVGTNLPWVAALLGGLPAAAGVFLTSKIFERQVDRLSSLSYTIKGSFDDPDIEVEKIFTDPTENPGKGQ